VTKEAFMSEWIDPRHAETVARFRSAQAAVKPTACKPCDGRGVQRDGVTPCHPCEGSGQQRAVRAFITS
jgi:DnaJ-class molecular chaperone